LGNIGSAPKNDNESEEARPASISATGETTEVKVAFLGDSGNGKGFRSNLKLIREQNVDLVIHEGDFDYRRKPKEFWQSIKDELGPDIPYFLVIGNHDTSRWDTEDGYAGQMTEYLENIGIEFESYQNYYRRWSIPYKGLRLVAVGQDNEKNDEKDRFLRDELNSAEENWKICNWHKNQRAMQLGGKGNEMGWSVYETCREQGALIITGHEHSYERTKTLVNIEKQTVDPDCPDPNNICVGPGRSFVVVSGLGGLDIRDQQRCHPFEYPYGCKEEWAFIYTNQQNAKHGTLFITFNVDNNPNKAHGEFITIHGEVVDSFDITKD